MKTKLIGICFLLAAFSVTGCGHDSNETASEITSETEILSQTESTITETKTEVTTEVTSTKISNAKPEDFLGEWACGNTILYITHMDAANYLGYIISYENPHSTDVYDSWIYELQYQNGKLICNGKGRRYHSDMNTPPPSVETKYLNGSMEFILLPEGIIWNDLTEHLGDGMVFKYSETQPDFLS